MYLLLDTSTATCRVTLVDGDAHMDYEWLADRELAKGLLKYLVDCLAEHGRTIADMQGLAVYQGPGSFTGLRIGITTLNTIASSERIAIVGATGDDWQVATLARLAAGEDDKIVLPEYGRDARITTPRK